MPGKEPPKILQWISVICGISGITITTIIRFFFSDTLHTLVIGSTITIVATAIVGVVSAKNYQKMLAKKDEELAKKDAKIKELNEEFEVWRNILISETPAQAGYYMSNKKVYDNFKTKLEILDCNLDVRLVQDSKDEKNYHLQFNWTLKVLNSTEKPVEKARFIYSGDKNDTSHPKVTYNGKRATVTMKMEENVAGDDRFIEIGFPTPLKHNISADICINYTLSKYNFNPNYDFIWLVPDALGFANMSRFRIRFFSDGVIVKHTTVSVLRSYVLSGKYPQEDDELVEFKQFDEGKEGFECTKDEAEELRRHGFLLILTNDRKSLPDYLQNIPTQNN